MERYGCLRPETKDTTSSKLPAAREEGCRSIIAKLAYWHGGHNASENSWGRLGMQVNVEDDEAVAEYFYREIGADARRPLEEEIVRLKARIFDLTSASPVLPMKDCETCGRRRLEDGESLLSEKERRVVDLLAEAWNWYIELEKIHPNHVEEFRHAIHRAQNLVMGRPVQRELNAEA